MGTDLRSLDGSPLGELIELANIEKIRLLRLFAQERKSGSMLPHGPNCPKGMFARRNTLAEIVT
jgi:hypothetical protein